MSSSMTSRGVTPELATLSCRAIVALEGVFFLRPALALAPPLGIELFQPLFDFQVRFLNSAVGIQTRQMLIARGPRSPI